MRPRFGLVVVFWILVSSAGVFVLLPAPVARAGTSVAGPLPGDTTWTLADSPVWVEGTVWVPVGMTLTVEAGVEVRFNGPHDLVVNGTLEVQGMAVAPAVFTSNQTSPSVGDWGKILLQGVGSSVAYANITYGFECLSVTGSTNDILGTRVSNCATGATIWGTGNLFRDGFAGSSGLWMINVGGTDNEIRNNTVLADFGSGIFIGGANALVEGNAISVGWGTGFYGIELRAPGTTGAIVRGNSILGASGPVDTGVILAQGVVAMFESNSVEGFGIGLSAADATFWSTNDTFRTNGADFYFTGPGNAQGIALNDTFDPAKVVFEVGAAGSSLRTRWFLDVNVTNVLGAPVPGAIVSATDALGGPEFFGATGPDGHAPWIRLTESVRGRSFWLNYTPHMLGAFLLGPDGVNDTVLMDRSKSVTLVLDNDLLAPRITSVTATPDPQEQFLAVNVTANVQDQNLASVRLNVTYPDASWTNVSMSPAGGDAYFVQRTYAQVGVHAFRVTAMDGFGNTSTADGTFRVTAPLPPAITNVSAAPDPQDYGGAVNVTATVRDPHGVPLVTVSLRFPDASTATYPMVALGDVWSFEQSYGQIGLHGFTIHAVDGTGAASEANGTFRIVDAISPVLTNVSAVPDPQVQGASVNVSARIADASPVAATLNVTYPDGSWLEAPMAQAGTAYSLARTYAQVGLHRFNITATDASGNVGMANGTFVIWPPNTGPSVTNVAATPDPQEYGGPVNVTAVVADPDGIASVSLRVTFPDSSTATYSMANAGATWYYERAYAMLGSYAFTVTATDGNVTYPMTGTGNGTFRIQDSISPVADAGADQLVAQFGSASFDGSGSLDNVGVVNYTWTFTDVTPRILYGVSPSYRFDRLGVYAVTLTVRDDSGNMGSDGMIVTVQDVTPPQIANASATPSPAETPGATNVSFRVLEANTVAIATIEGFDPVGASLGNVSAALDAGSSRFYATWALTVLGTYRFALYAEDQSGNWAADAFTVLARDTVVPAVAAVGAIPSLQEILTPVLLWAQVTDPFLASVAAEVLVPGGGTGNVTLVYNAGTGRYEGTYVPGALGVYALTVWALDSSGNVGSRGDTFAAQDTTDPVASGFTAAPQPQEVGGTVDISVIASDNHIVAAVRILIVGPSGVLGPYDMVFSPSDGRWHDVRAYTQIGTYSVTVTAFDLAGNTGMVAGPVGIVDTTPPVVSNLVAWPSTWERGGTITVNATATDNLALQRVSLQVLDPTSREVGNHTMTCDGAGLCTFTRAYGLAGTYTLRVWAFDTSNNHAMVQGALVMSEGAGPTADAGPDQTVNAGDPVTLDGTGSTDDFGIVSYRWSFMVRGVEVERTGAVVQVLFADPGEYAVTLNVTDAAGRWATDTVIVTVAGGVTPSGGILDWWPFLLIVLLLAVVVTALALALARRRAARKPPAPEKEAPAKPSRKPEAKPREAPKPKPVEEPPSKAAEPPRGEPSKSEKEIDEEIDDVLEELEELEDL